MSNVRLVQDVYAAFGRGDVAAVRATFDAGILWREAEGNPYRPDGQPWVGPDAVAKNLFARLGAEWEAFTVLAKQFHDAGGTVIVEGRYTGKYAATGGILDAQLCHIWTIRSGKITGFQQYVDTAQLQDTMQAS